MKPWSKAWKQAWELPYGCTKRTNRKQPSLHSSAWTKCLVSMGRSTDYAVLAPSTDPILSEGRRPAHPALAPQNSTSGPSELGLREQSGQTCTPLHTTFLRLIVVHWQPSAWLFRSSVTAAGPHTLAHCKRSTTLAQGHEYSCVISPDVGEGHN